MRGALHILSGAGPARVVELENGTYSIGRDATSVIQIDSKQVSRHHADIVVDDSAIRLLDRGSSNGTVLNGVPVSHGVLRDGDRITIGEVVLEFHAQLPSLATRKRVNPSRPVTRSGLIPAKGRLRQPRSLRILLTGGLVAALALVVGGASYSFRRVLEDRLQTEALLRAQVLVRYLAEKNREDLRLGNEFLLDAESIKKESGVREAFIIGKKGRILAPLSRLQQAENDPFVTEALAQNSDRPVSPSPLLPNGTRILVHPIRAYNDKLGQYQTLGVAKLVFSPSAAMGSAAEIERLTLLLSISALGLALVLGWMFTRILSAPLLQLSERIHQWRSGQIPEEMSPPFKDWRPLYEVIDRTIEDDLRKDRDK